MRLETAVREFHRKVDAWERFVKSHAEDYGDLVETEEYMGVADWFTDFLEFCSIEDEND